MRVRFLSIAVLIGSISFVSFPKVVQANPAEACQSLLCLYGLQNHSKNPACLPALNKFFRIQVYTPFFNPVETAVAREKYLNQCPEAYTVEKFIAQIIAHYGMIILPPV
ncbi:MAG: hypothetical protein J6P29_03825 [Acetobacter sp.]|nr:hypothetical protein [Acetobacter sp.]